MPLLSPYQFFSKQTNAENLRRLKFKLSNNHNIDTSELQNVKDAYLFPRIGKDGKLRFDLIQGKALGSGASSIVFSIDATLTPEKIKFHSKKRGTPRILKLFGIDDTFGGNCQLEANNAQYMPHLHIKGPYQAKISIALRKSYLNWVTMDRMPGDTLFRILKKKQIDSAQKLQDVTLAILISFKNQIADPGVIHFDIQPNNLMISLDSFIQVNFIDAGAVIMQSVFRENEMKPFPGTHGYCSPEVRKKSKQKLISQKSSIYSLGVTLDELWKNKYVKDKVDKATRSSVLSIFKTMQENEPSKRPQIDSVIEQFMTVPFIAESPPSPFSSSSS